jgi:predicted MPP superfamily phosphohydrolase
VAGVDGELPTLLMDHQPANLAEAVENNIDVQISGHTHNGQIYPVSRIVAKMYELAYGYRKKGKTHFYVSSGLGLWGAPIRLGTQSEIVKMKLNFIPANSK